MTADAAPGHDRATDERMSPSSPAGARAGGAGCCTEARSAPELLMGTSIISPRPTLTASPFAAHFSVGIVNARSPNAAQLTPTLSSVAELGRDVASGPRPRELFPRIAQRRGASSTTDVRSGS